MSWGGGSWRFSWRTSLQGESLAALHMTADVILVRNQYIRGCALLLDRALRAFNSAIQARLNAWLAVTLTVPMWTPLAVRVEPEGRVVPFVGLRGEHVVGMKEV